MAIHFASARDTARTPFSRFLVRRIALEAANDNAAAARDGALQAALRHFAIHGLGAAHEARGQAERAFFSGDRASYQHWLEICRILDRRMARMLSQAVENGKARV